MKTLATILLLATGFSSPAPVLFDGSNDILGFGTMGDVAFKENGAITFSVWFNATSLGENNVSPFIRRGSNLLRIGATEAVFFSILGATALTRNSVNSVFAFSTWTHVCVTWDGSLTAANAHIYVNGTEVSYATTTDMVTPTDNSTASVNLGNNDGTTVTFNGQLCEAAIFPSVVTAADIVKLSQSRTGQMPLMCSVAPTAYWPLNDFSDLATVTGTGTIRDFSNNGNHGTATNSPVARANVVITGP